MIALLRYWPYIALVVLLGLLWGMVGYVKHAREVAAQATTRAETAESSLASLKLKQAADEALLARRETDLITARARSAKLERAIREFQPAEACLTLDQPYDWLAPFFVLPSGDRVRPPGS